MSSPVGLSRTSSHAIGPKNATAIPTQNQVVRHPCESTAAPTAGNAPIKPIATSTANIPIAKFNRRANHLPTSARLTTDSALCPNARVSVNVTNNTGSEVVRLIATTAAPNANVTKVITNRGPARSVNRPTGKHNNAPTSVAQKFTVANITRSMPQSANKGSVTSPNPCVRPGSVATIASAAKTKLTQP